MKGEIERYKRGRNGIHQPTTRGVARVFASGERSPGQRLHLRFLPQPVAPHPIMSRRMSVALLALLELATSAVVLPRPPPSLNHIQHDRQMSARKSSALLTAARPDTEDYRLLEIELRSAGEMDATNLQGLERAMLKQERVEEAPNNDYPNPEVIPHSILGVRDVGLSSSYYRVRSINDDKLYDSKYNWKNSRPKVYVNVRGRSGSFREDKAVTATTLQTRPFERRIDWKTRSKKVPSKESSRPTIHLFTTENTIVTSSELPKQIPAPPSKSRRRISMTQTTPVQKYASKRTDILPGYSFTDQS